MIKRASVGQKQQGLRLDETLTQLFAEISRSEARRIIDRGGCSVNSAMARIASRKACFGDAIEIGIMEKGRFKELILPPQALLYEDDDLVALDKPAGVNSQRTPYQLRGTMEFWVSEYFRSEGVTEPARIVHRLDRGTSGAMVFPKHKRAAAWLSNAFHDGMIEKAYFAIVCGRPAEEAWVIDAPIGKIASGRYGVVAGGKSAVTRFRLLFCCQRFFSCRSLPGNRAHSPDTSASRGFRHADSWRPGLWRRIRFKNDAPLSEPYICQPGQTESQHTRSSPSGDHFLSGRN